MRFFRFLEIYKKNLGVPGNFDGYAKPRYGGKRGNFSRFSLTNRAECGIL